MFCGASKRSPPADDQPPLFSIITPGFRSLPVLGLSQCRPRSLCRDIPHPSRRSGGRCGLMKRGQNALTSEQARIRAPPAAFRFHSTSFSSTSPPPPPKKKKKRGRPLR